MEDAAILSAIFSEEEDKQHDGDSFSDKPDPDAITKDRTNYATDEANELEPNQVGEEHSNSASHTSPGCINKRSA